MTRYAYSRPSKPQGGGELSTDLELEEVPESIVFKDAKRAEIEGEINSEEFGDSLSRIVIIRYQLGTGTQIPGI
eukprot:SAG11_NODE_1417_length_4966_cov_4.590592_6_plen_74_part_00